MYGIGTVARLAQVSARTLRHYHEIGLLTPAYVDQATGYRHYTPEQVLRLHRILVLRDLGVPLSAVGSLVDDDVTAEQLRGILLLRRAEARDRLTTQIDQLRRVELRLAQLEEGPMNGYDVIVKPLDPVRVVALSADITGPEEIAETGGRMWPRLQAALDRHRVEGGGLSFMLYEDTGDAERPMRLTTALPVPSGITIADGDVTTREIAAVARAATTVVRGAPDQFGDAFRALNDWITQSGERATSFEREVYLDCDGPPDTWVTELQTVLAG
ncbi:DNA-binding transcriptional regulator, MerR family [Amycolatopsis tolypomycina]|uniref:DNA-binding transcriptional regulator, MerR family n=1 Tax=Amycolatopsis tolypomycina TaxID=208445 RepID=A0A1H4VN30_9PSEU|nr:MerR family transcriptional regulator [Amycolatopsis tolypomycina]SEC82519.1 DNA-binding transcriptional regulator, MerR family [Amycolatopsis tolypomycina]